MEKEGLTLITCGHCGKDIINPRKNQQYCCNSCARFERIRKPIEYEYNTRVWSCGGGVQSTAIAALICSGRLPIPEYSLMVDVGMERTSTWDYVYNHLMPNLNKYGVDLKILKTSDYTDVKLFYNGCFLLPAHRYKDGVRYKMRTMCNGAWKVQVQRKYLKDNGVEDFENWIGISTDERRRAKHSSVKMIKITYPLIEQGLSRYGCLDLIKSMGWEVPPHTHCWCCPNATNDEWLDLKLNYPEDWKKAVELEREVRAIDSEIYLHNSLKTLDEAFS